MIRLIATDMDDTLLTSAGELTDRTQLAISRAMARGIRVTLASGRMLPSVLPYAKRLSVNSPLILYNGGLIYDHRAGESIWSRALPREDARAIARAVEEAGCYLQAYSDSAFYCEEITEYTKMYSRSVGVPGTATGQKLSEWLDFPPLKLLSISGEEEILDLQRHLSALFPSGVNFLRSKPKYLEIVTGGVDKGLALDRLAAHLGIDRTEIAAFGDGQNDIPLLRAAGEGYAISGSAAARSGEFRIAPSNDEDGVAQRIEEILRREE